MKLTKLDSCCDLLVYYVSIEVLINYNCNYKLKHFH